MSKIFCNEDLGKILYEDKIQTINQIDTLGEFLSIYSNNNKISKELFDSLNNLKKKRIIENYFFVEKYNSKNGFLEFLNSKCSKVLRNNTLYLCNGINDIGYICCLEDITYSKDLKPIYNLQITQKDIINPIIAKNNKLYKELNYETIEFINNLDFTMDEKILIIGNDLGYIPFLLKNTKKELYIYDYNEELFNFTINNIYNKIDNVNITYINDLDNIKDNFKMFDKIILLNDFVSSFYTFINYKLYNYTKNTKIINNKKIELKLKEDLRDFIYTGRDNFINLILNDLKNPNEYNLLQNAQLDYIEKINEYFIKHNIYFDSYKSFNKFINNNANILNILNCF